MSKFKVGDKVIYKGKVCEISNLNILIGGLFWGYYLKGYDSYVDEQDLKPYKTPHQRLLDMGFIGQEPFWGDYRLYKKGTFINIVIISFNIKDKDYVIWKQDDEVSIEQFYPVNLELAEILVDYLKEL